MELKIDEKEVLRYLGYKGAAADERVSSLIAELIEIFKINIEPKSVYGIWDCQIETPAVTFGGVTANSKNLAHHLIDCHSVVLLAATLGTQADALIRQFSVQDMEKAVIANAVCAAMIEAFLDSLTKKIESELSKKSEFNGLYLTARFSPGYGDFDIAHQKDILNMLDCQKRIGLTLSDGFMLIPSKSVTAVIGFSKEKKNAAHNCETCTDKNCKLRATIMKIADKTLISAINTADINPIGDIKNVAYLPLSDIKTPSVSREAV